MSDFQDVQRKWASRPLIQRRQSNTKDCSATCLLMLLTLRKKVHALSIIPDVIATSDFPLWAASFNIFLEAQPITRTQFDAGTYLILAEHHWRIVRLVENEELITLHDPDVTYVQHCQLGDPILKFMESVSCIFRVLWTEMS